MKKLLSLTLALMLVLPAVPVMIGNEESVLAFTAFVDTAKCEEAEMISGRGSAWELTFDESVKMDQPEGTIITNPFFSSIMTNVQTKK